MATGSSRGRRGSSKSSSRAGSARKNNSRSSAKGSRNNSRKVNKTNNSGIFDEVIIFIVIGLAILIFLGMLGMLGSFGEFVRKILIGLFGMVGYIFPFAFLFSMLLLVSNKWGRVSRLRIGIITLLLAVLSCFSQLIFAKDAYIEQMTDYFTDSVKNGGFIGGIITHFLCKFLGMAGTIVILIVLLIISIMLLTDRSVISGVREGSKYLGEDVKRRRQYNKEVSKLRNEEREVRELEREERERERRQKRQEKYEEKLKLQEEKKKAELLERRRRIEEKVLASDRIKFDRTDLRKQGFGEVNESVNMQLVDVNDYTASEEELDRAIEAKRNIEEAQMKNRYQQEKTVEPESMFYGSAYSYSQTAYMPDTQAIIQSTDDAIAIAQASNGGILSATKLDRQIYNGDMSEITDNYSADDEFKEYINNMQTAHKINVNYEADNVDGVRQEAYERDIYIEDQEQIDKDFDEVANLFNRKKKDRSDQEPGLDTARLEQMINAVTNPSSFGSNNGYYEKTSTDNSQNEIFYNNAADSYNYREDANVTLDNSYDEFHNESANITAFQDNTYTDEAHEDNPYMVDNRPSVSMNYEAETVALEKENAKPAPVSQVVSQGKAVKSKRTGKYKLPPIDLLDEVSRKISSEDEERELYETGQELKDALQSFGLKVEIIGSARGPAVTRYELQMPAGVSVKKITNLSDDIMMSLGAKDIRIEAPIPGKKAVGIEIPNRESTMVHFRELIDSRSFRNFESKVAFGVGKDLSGDIVVSDISKMPHLLIAGATGSGKSVCINTLIMSILFKADPEEVKLIMIDPKQVELSIYNDIPHLLIPVVTDPKKASAALAWAVNEMTIRYQKFAELGTRDMKGYNNKIKTDPNYADNPSYEYMPQIVIVVDELADLMMVAGKEVEASICRIAQLARAAGIYLILATQRPSVDVITGLIKANMPSRIAFSVSSFVDSKTILDQAGAERLLGNGDMLFFPRGYNKPARVQGAFVSDDEVQRVVDYVRGQSEGNNYSLDAMGAIEAGGASSAGGSGGLVDPEGAFDDLFTQAGHAVIESGKASIGMLQRKFKVGFNRAARIMDQLADNDVVGPEEGTKPRRILMTMEEFNHMLEEMNHR